MQKRYYTYILANRHHTTLYVGVTNNLTRRTSEHGNKRGSWFTSKYNISKLVYFEVHDRIENAIAREKQIKAGSRLRKLELIQSLNPGWRDLGK
ncbi:MAG: GIY-YIG nuclease family protein [Deltaproteobacteria bacterium]|nr:GIY-YIG nuclease family protein [Deltaproteobacteria bacterium]